MIEFNEKSFAEIGREEGMVEVHTLKDFPQESIYQFMKFREKTCIKTRSLIPNLSIQNSGS